MPAFSCIGRWQSPERPVAVDHRRALTAAKDRAQGEALRAACVIDTDLSFVGSEALTQALGDQGDASSSRRWCRTTTRT